MYMLDLHVFIIKILIVNIYEYANPNSDIRICIFKLILSYSYFGTQTFVSQI